MQRLTTRVDEAGALLELKPDELAARDACWQLMSCQPCGEVEVGLQAALCRHTAPEPHRTPHAGRCEALAVRSAELQQQE